MRDALSVERILAFSAELVWPVLSDTAGMNRKLGLAPMKFSTENGVRVGQQKLLGSVIEWTEGPWQWRQNAWLTNERVYKNGFFKSIAGRFELEPMGPSQCRVTLTFAPVYRSKIWKPLLSWATKRILVQLLDAIESTVDERAGKSKLEVPKRSLKDWLTGVQDVERAKIAPKEVASLTASTWQQVFSEALAERQLTLRFEALCPHCRGGKQSAPRLTDLPEKVFCESCEIDFAINTQDSIEVSFRDNTIPAHLLGLDFCSADVTHKPAIVYQRLGPAWRESLTLAPGVYSLKKKGEARSLSFQVEELMPAEELVLDELWFNPTNSLRKIGPRVTLVARSLPQDSLIMLEQLSKVRGALFATEVLTVPEFIKVMPAESLVTTFPMEMGERSVLFTDVVGSTDMYFQIGDTAAFQKVRESFLLIGEIAQRNKGVLVKTIGDATMYSFLSAADALRTALEIQLVNRQRDTKLRITLHHGPCLSVGTKDGPDFFGDTVNVCAKFQAVAGADQVAFERGMRELMPAELWQELIKGHQVEEVAFEIKSGTSRKFELYRVTL